MLSCKEINNVFQVFICRLGGNTRVSVIIFATCWYPVSWFNLLAASHNFRAAHRNSSWVSKYNSSTWCHWVDPDHWDQAVAQPLWATGEVRLVIYKFIMLCIWATNLIIITNVILWLKMDTGEPKTWKWHFAISNSHELELWALWPGKFIWNLKKVSFNCLQRLYNCPWVGEFENSWTRKEPKIDHGKQLNC